MTQPTPESPAKDAAGIRRTVFFAVLAGLCPLIPIPFIDDIALDLVRKQLAITLFSAYGLRPSPAHLASLLQAEKSNALLGCIGSFVLYPLKKMFRKIFFVLAIKDCVDAASAVLHEGLLLRHALASGLVDDASLAQGIAVTSALSSAIRSTCKQTDTRPVNQAFRRVFSASRAGLSGAAAALAAIIRSKGGNRKNTQSVEQAFASVEQGANPQVDRLVDDLGDQMFAETGYLEALKKRFEDNFRTAMATPSTP